MKKLLTLVAMFTTATITYAQRYRGFDDEPPKFRIGVQGGWSYLLAKVSDDVPTDLRPYIKQLKSGYSFGADATFFFNRTIGVGVKYSSFHTKNELDNIYAIDTLTGKIRTGKLKDNITIQYIGPTFNTRIIAAGEKLHFITYASLGYLSYKNNATAIDDYTLTSGTLGTALGLGLDFAITENFFLGADICGTFGTLNYYQYESATESKRIELKENEYEGVSRVDISAGVRWNF